MKRTTMLCGLLLHLGISLPILAAPGEPVSSWDVLMEQGLAPRSVAALEREILELLTPEQAKEFARGTAASEIRLLDGRTLDDLLRERGVTTSDLSWFSVDGGGGVATGGVYRLVATIGQPDAGRLTGGIYTLRGGFLQPSSADPIFNDGFESGDLSGWSSAVGGS
ncbi:MAG: hypothetical protein GY856_25410 [bacterium]|nr:hypothetical protein [bacterium]